MKHWIFRIDYGTIPSFQPTFAQRVSVIHLPSYQLFLRILLAILMMAGGAVETLAASLATATFGDTNSSERAPISEEDDNEVEKEGRLEERHAVERHRSDRHLNSVQHLLARLSTASLRPPVLSQRPIDIGRSPPVLC
jgi:hypothetical protein